MQTVQFNCWECRPSNCDAVAAAAAFAAFDAGDVDDGQMTLWSAARADWIKSADRLIPRLELESVHREIRRFELQTVIFVRPSSSMV